MSNKYNHEFSDYQLPSKNYSSGSKWYPPQPSSRYNHNDDDEYMEDDDYVNMEAPIVEYDEGISDLANLMTLKEFLDKHHNKELKTGGWGLPCKDGKASGDVNIRSDTLHLIPKDCTHILWYE